MTEIEKNLKKMADEIPVPEKLLPDQIEKKLKNNRKKPHRYVRGVCVAAAAVIVVGAGVMMWQNQKMSPQKQLILQQLILAKVIIQHQLQ